MQFSEMKTDTANMNHFFSDSVKRPIMEYNDTVYHTPKRQRILKSTSTESISDDYYNNNNIVYDTEMFQTPKNCFERPFSLSSFPLAPRKSTKSLFLISDNDDEDDTVIIRRKKLPCLPLMDDISTTSYGNRIDVPLKLSARRSPIRSSIVFDDDSVSEDDCSSMEKSDVSSVWDSCISPTCVSAIPMSEPPILKKKIEYHSPSLSLQTCISRFEDEQDDEETLLMDKRDISLLRLPSLSSTCYDSDEEVEPVSKPMILSMRPRAISNDEMS
jgi:hypothetical protein